ncbi:DUF2157 domain-containing protein [Microbaculum sp. FT89]|uniref:DUF2157 domain-containing protein n=1 Tax=Microbaculum sp. FT89 TaxID=3447298 RepID=UPI003F52C003
MLDALYKRRLEADLRTWRERGWVTQESAQSILDTVKVDGGPRTAIVIGFLGAILIAFAAIAFVAANWSEIARPLRLAILVGGMAVCYGSAVLFDRARHPWFADAAIFAGAALFGAAIMLVAQSYHISGDYPDALLMWGAGAFFAAVLGPSRAALPLALGVLGLWSWYEMIEFDWTVHWPFLIPLALMAVVVSAWNWRPGMHLVVLALMGWIVVVVFKLADTADLAFATSVGLCAAAALAMFGTGRFTASRAEGTKTGRLGSVLSTYGLFAFLASLIVLQFALRDSPTPEIGDEGMALIAAAVIAVIGSLLLAAAASGLRAIALDAAMPILAAVGAAGLTLAAANSTEFANSLTLQVLLGILVIAASVWAAAYGTRHHSRSAATFGLLAFAGEVLYLYFVTFGTLLDTALFFLVGGLLLIGLAAILVRLQRRLSPPIQGEPA